MGLKYKLTNNTVYSLRKTAGGTDQEINYSYDTLIGGSVGWNQLIRNGNFADSSNWSTYNATLSVSNNTAILTATQSSSPNMNQRISIPSGHKSVLMYEARGSASGNISYYINDGGLRKNKSVSANVWTDVCTIRSVTQNATTLYIYTAEVEGYTLDVRNVQLIDLTPLFGSTIADYLYSLESATSGAGIAKLREWGFIGDAYIPYDAGSIKSVEASAKVTRDASDNIIGNYPLDSSLTLRGIPKLTDGKLWYDGDKYEADGPVTRKYNTTTVSEAVEVGTSSGGVKYARVNTLPDAKNNGYVFSAKYVYRNVVNVDKVIRMIGTSVYIYDNRFTDTSTANDILQGEELLYELATPTTESAVPFTNPQIVDDFGTEEYVTGNGVPVGHETVYYDVPENSLSIGKVLDYTGLKYFWSKVKAYFTGGTGITVSNGTINHSNSITAKTTQAVYPITFDAQGHINSAGTAVTIPTNLVNGSTTGSLRTINSDESSSYTIGQYATALGGDVKAAGNYSAALNFGTTAAGNSQTVIGKYNTVDTNDTYALIIGNGSDDSSRSDALAVSWTGNVYAKDYISGTTSDTVAHSYTAVNNNRNASFRIDANGTMGVYDHTNSAYILSNNASKTTVLNSPSGGITYLRGGGGTAGSVRINTSNHTDLYPIGSTTNANHRVSYFSMTNATTLLINAQANASSYGSYNIAVSSSDVRLKKNVEDTDVEALPIIEQIRMRQFDWKADDTHQSIGMIADEIEKIDPKLAIGGGYEEDGTMNVKTIDTFYLIGYLVKAVQELSEKVKQLENNNNNNKRD